MARCDILLLFASFVQGQPSPQVLHFGSHSGLHFVFESDPKKGTKKSSKLVFFWHPLGLTWGTKCLAFSVQMGCDDVLLSHLAAKVFKSTVLGRFRHSWGTSKVCNCHRFLRLHSHFTLMRLCQQQITTCSVYTTIMLALHRLVAPRAPRTNLNF